MTKPSPTVRKSFQLDSTDLSTVGKWAVQEPKVFPGLKGDVGLVVTNPAAHHAISAPLSKPIDPAAETLVVQYEVKLQNGLECGGAYVKLLTESPEGVQAKEFSDKSAWAQPREPS